MFFFMSASSTITKNTNICFVLWGEIIFIGGNWFKGKGNGRGSHGDEGGERTTLLATDPIILLSFSYFSNIFFRFGETIDQSPKRTKQGDNVKALAIFSSSSFGLEEHQEDSYKALGWQLIQLETAAIKVIQEEEVHQGPIVTDYSEKSIFFKKKFRTIISASLKWTCC